MQVYRALLETAAGEHGARMTAMEAASKNAQEMIGLLTIQYNKARQERITKELLDIVGRRRGPAGQRGRLSRGRGEGACEKDTSSR